MTNNTTEKSVIGKIKMKVGEWKYITTESFCSLYKDDTLLWSSIDPNIVKVNPNSGLLYASDVGTTTVFATDIKGTDIELICYIEVEATEQYLKTQKLSANTSSTMATRCCDSGYGDVSALGYSGTVFEYKIIGSRVTLEKGFGAKNGTSNIYSDLFRANLVEMNNIYASMSPTQRAAWMELRLRGLLDTVISWLTSSPEELAKSYIKDALINTVISMDEIEALIYGCRSWYRVEQSAISNYQAF